MGQPTICPVEEGRHQRPPAVGIPLVALGSCDTISNISALPARGHSLVAPTS